MDSRQDNAGMTTERKVPRDYANALPIYVIPEVPCRTWHGCHLLNNAGCTLFCIHFLAIEL